VDDPNVVKVSPTAPATRSTFRAARFPFTGRGCRPPGHDKHIGLTLPADSC